MASAAIASQPSDRSSRIRPFTSWVKRLTSLKSSDVRESKKAKKSDNIALKNNPYPQSGYVHRPAQSIDTENRSYDTRDGNGSTVSLTGSDNIREPLAESSKSAAPTVATNPDTVHSDAGNSRALTTKTGGGLSSMDGVGANSTFSSPNQSQQSLTTTLTTIQSTSPGNVLNQHTGHADGISGAQFSHQYPVSPAPASAIPPHLVAHSNPTTYSQATANNLLTDDASIMTLASSTRRRRRRSMDTDASVRAMAPSSVWGGSRESLPLSVLSGNLDHVSSPSGLHAPAAGRPSIGAIASAERASVYSNSGVAAPALASDRNSYYAGRKQDKDARSIDGRSLYRDTEDGKSVFGGKSLYGGESLRGYEGSIRSGALGHGRNDSIPGSIGSPLSPVGRPMGPPSRHNSIYRADHDDHDGDRMDEEDDEEEEEEDDMEDRTEREIHDHGAH